MSSFEKSVKGATKIKNAPPKTKYIEHILVATHSGELGVAEVFRALQNRLRDSTWTVVFKGLITVHLMVREGSPDVTLQYISKHPTVLAISSFTDVQTQGRNIRHYSSYLMERAKAYGKSKTDWVGIDELRLERVTVDKGLLRETELVQRQLHALLKCDVLDGEPDSEIAITVFRLLVLDLLALFQVVNQGMINILGHFFEMSKPDAERAMEIYRTFTKQTDFVVAYLSVARQHEHHTRVEVPKLKHAPVNLGRQLEDYLEDPDFEIHRRQYLAEQDSKKRFKSSKAVTPSKTDFPSEMTSSLGDLASNNPFPKAGASKAAQPQAVEKPAAKGPEPDLIDLFESIEQNQTTMNTQPTQSFVPQPAQTGFQMQQPGFPQQQAGFMPQQTGFQQPNQFQPQQTGFQPQQTAFPQQQTGFQQQQQQPAQQLQTNFTGAGFGGFTPQPSNNFQPNTLGSIPQQSAANYQSPPMSPPVQQMPGGGLQPQQTGQTTNPFRASMMMSQQTGMQSNPVSSFSSPGGTPTLQRQSTNPFARSPPQNVSPFQPAQQQQQQSPAPLIPAATGTNPFARNVQSAPQSPAVGPQQGQQQPGSLVPQATGTTNPFRQGAFVNHQTGMGWQHNQVPMGGGLDQMQTSQVFPRPAQQTPWGQQQ